MIISTEHPRGQITNRGILDVGKGCDMNCSFCYYEKGTRKGFESITDMCATLEHIKRIGKTDYDITGGEPAICPGIEEVIRYGKSIGLRGRMITSGWHLLRGKKMFYRLLDAGLDSFRFSVHGFHEVHDRIVGKSGAFSELARAMLLCYIEQVPFTTNTVLTDEVLGELPDLIQSLSDRGSRFISLINYNRCRDKAHGAVSREEWFSTLHRALTIALDDFPCFETPIAVRYVPMCVLLERHRKYIVGVRQYMLDPEEWENQGETPQSFEARAEIMVNRRNSYGHKCFTCSLRPICDGVDRDYVKENGWNEISPVRCGPSVSNVLHYRYHYKRAFTTWSRS